MNNNQFSAEKYIYCGNPTEFECTDKSYQHSLKDIKLMMLSDMGKNVSMKFKHCEKCKKFFMDDLQVTRFKNYFSNYNFKENSSKNAKETTEGNNAHVSPKQKELSIFPKEKPIYIARTMTVNCTSKYHDLIAEKYILFDAAKQKIPVDLMTCKHCNKCFMSRNELKKYETDEGKFKAYLFPSYKFVRFDWQENTLESMPTIKKKKTSAKKVDKAIKLQSVQYEGIKGEYFYGRLLIPIHNSNMKIGLTDAGRVLFETGRVSGFPSAVQFTRHGKQKDYDKIISALSDCYNHAVSLYKEICTQQISISEQCEITNADDLFANSIRKFANIIGIRQEGTRIYRNAIIIHPETEEIFMQCIESDDAEYADKNTFIKNFLPKFWAVLAGIPILKVERSISKSIKSLSKKPRALLPVAMPSVNSFVEDTNDDLDFITSNKVRIKPNDFVVRVNLFYCINKEHKLIDIIGVVRVLNKINQVIDVEIPAAYCPQCKRFYILESEYRRLKSQGFHIICKIVENDYWEYNSIASEYFMNKRSVLNMLGYNVNAQVGLTETQRWRLLEVIVDEHILTKAEICSHLSYLINRSRRRGSLKTACLKWMQDREHIRMYNPIDPAVTIGTIYAKKIDKCTNYR